MLMQYYYNPFDFNRFLRSCFKTLDHVQEHLSRRSLWAKTEGPRRRISETYMVVCEHFESECNIAIGH